jgi:phage/plasmid primase-like uncharacterized protein
MSWLLQPANTSRRPAMKTKSSQASLGTTPYKKTYHRKYDIDYIRRKAKNCWDEIWDDLGIPMFNMMKGTCPLCKHNNTFQVTDISTGIFHCSHCKVRGDGLLLLQHYYKWDLDEAVERLGRNLRLREKETIYG